MTFELEYVEVLERSREVYRYGISFDPEYLIDQKQIRLSIIDTDQIKFVRPLPRKPILNDKRPEIKLSDDFLQAEISYSPGSDELWFGVEYDVTQKGCTTETDEQFFVTRCRPMKNNLPNNQEWLINEPR